MCQHRYSSPISKAQTERADDIVARELEQLRRDATADATSRRQEYLFAAPAPLDGWLRGMVNDQRDMPLVYLLFNIICTSCPAAALIWVWPCTSHWVGAAYLVATYALFLQRFMLTLHFSEHRPLFRRGELRTVVHRYWIFIRDCVALP